MSHRLSQSARHTNDLLEELERDKELDVLREYLTRFELFPRKRDPAAAPIRFEELKELVKHWKLHRQRNFWKTHTTKEDLVRTLYRHINTKIIPQEARDESQTNSGLAANSPMTSSPGIAPSAPVGRRSSTVLVDSPRSKSIIGLRPTPPTNRGPRSENVFGSYNGDLFGQRGDYEDGMIYLSRFRKPSNLMTSDGIVGLNGSAASSDITSGRHDKEQQQDEDEDEQESSAEALDVAHSLSREIRLKQECAFSIYHFTTTAGHERRMVAEGCMLALSKLSNFEDLEVKRFCAAAILNLTYEPTMNAKMADEGVLLVLLELAKAQHEEVRRHTSMALCRFSYERGGQLRLVQEGCVSAILSMLNVPDLETKEACVKALINIASASGASVAESVVQILMKLAARKDPASVRFAAEAICNLSLLSGPRAKVVEDGLLDTVCELAQQSSGGAGVGDIDGEPEDGGDAGAVRRYLATALCNFSGLPSNMERLSHGRILECLEDLLQCEKPREVREMCAITIANISSHPSSLKNLALSDAVASLVELGAHRSSATVRENTALCLSNMSATAESRALLARFGVVALLLRFLEDDEDAEAGALAQQFAVLTLCSLLAHPAACVELVQSNVPAALAKLATRTPHDRVREFCAVALFNVSCEKTLHAVLLQDDTIRAIVRLCKRKGEAEDDGAAPGTPAAVAAATTAVAPSTPAAASGPPVVLLRHQECALGCLFNLSFGAESRAALLHADVVATLARLFHKPPARSDELLRQCAGVLANLSFDAEARARMVADHGVRLIRRIMSAASASAAAAAASDVPVSATAVSTTRETLRSCATACCNLAAEALEKTPVLDMLIDLSASSYAPTTLTCAIAFAKLASSAPHRTQLTRCAELYPALTLMMRCGVEDIQIYSAVALCNLAVEPPAARPVGTRYVWKEGTVPDFIVNALLRINSDSTKEICARALFNLLTHDDLRAAHIKDGVLYALVKLARLESGEIRGLCVTALYNLSCDPALADTLMELNVAQVVTKLCEMEFSSQEIHRRLAACLTHLAADTKPPAAAKKAATSDPAASGASGPAASTAVRLVEGGALVALLVLCEHADPPTRQACAAALCFLSVHRVNCEAMAALGLVNVLTNKLLLPALDDTVSVEESETTETTPQEQRHQHEFALNALCNISCLPALHDRVMEAGVVAQIVRLLAAGDEQPEGETVLLACVQTLDNLTFHARHRRALLTHGLVPALLERPRVLRSSPRVGNVCAELVATLCEDPQHWSELIASGAVRMLREIAGADPRAESSSTATSTALRACIYALSQLARCEKAGAAVLADGVLDVVALALKPETSSPDATSLEAQQETAERCAVILRALSTQGEAVCLLLMQDSRLVPLLRTVTAACCPGRRQAQASKHVILALYNLTACVSDSDDDASGMDALVRGGVVPLLVRLSVDGGGDMAPACAVALAHIKHRYKQRQAAEGEAASSDQATLTPEDAELKNLMEDGVVAALLAMLELDQTGIQRVDRLASAMPLTLPVLRVANEKDWTFLASSATLRFEAPLPVCWDFRSSAIDDARFVPAEPRSFLAVLAPAAPTTGSSVQDKLYGSYQVLQVRADKCRLQLDNPLFVRQAAVGLDSPSGGNTNYLADAIALAIAEELGDVDDDRRHELRASNSLRQRTTVASASSRSVASPGDDEDEVETRAPSPLKKLAASTARSLLARSTSSRGSAVFGVSGGGADGNSSLPHHNSKAAASASSSLPHRSSRSSVHDANPGGSGARKGSHLRPHPSGDSSSGVTLPKL